jgi:hypothetical protein
MAVSLLFALALAPIGAVGDDPGQSVPISMPDPVQTVNLWASFIEASAVDGAIALTLALGADAQELRSRYGEFAKRSKEKGHHPVALGHEIDGAVAIVHCFDGRLSEGRPDIDPLFLALDGRVWKVLPVFGKPELPLAGLDEARNASFAKLLAQYERESHELGERYAPMVGAGKERE